MPICLVGGDWLDVFFNPKYAGHVYKITVAADNLGNLVWICNLMPATSADVMIWDQHGPSQTHGQFFNFEVGAHDGAYKGCLHTVAPFIGRASLSEAQQEYNNIHGFYRTRVEHLFARLWQWRIACNVWTRFAAELHHCVCILLHFTQFSGKMHTCSSGKCHTQRYLQDGGHTIGNKHRHHFSASSMVPSSCAHTDSGT